MGYRLGNCENNQRYYRSLQIANEAGSHHMTPNVTELIHVPVLKLPAEKLDASLVALVTAENGLRNRVIDNILSNVYPHTWNTKEERVALEKRFMRALVAPTLTRLHFARSSPPKYFRPAPNASVLQGRNDEFRKTYTALCVFDFATLGLGLNNDDLPPDGSLRKSAAKSGDRMIDRVRGLDAILRFYLEYHPERGKPNSTGILKIGHPGDYKGQLEDLYDLLRLVLPKEQVIHVDIARSLVIRKLAEGGTMVSSFVVDQWLRIAIRQLKLSSFKAPFTAIDSLMDGTKAIGGVMISGRA
jgi:hypothetical protein